MRLFTSPKRRARPSVQDSTRLYVLTDIHGRADLLKQRFDDIDSDLETRPCPRAIEIYLGDYIDRGSDSFGVLELLLERQATHETVMLAGNHESFFVRAFSHPASLEAWCSHGGIETIRSYGVEYIEPEGKRERNDLLTRLAKAVPPDHLEFLKGLETSFEYGDYFFVHAGLRPGVPIERQKPQDMLWIREPFLQSDYRFDKIVVHGHSPVAEPEVRSNRINIDTKAYESGNLTCLVLEGEHVDFLAQTVETRSFDNV